MRPTFDASFGKLMVHEGGYVNNSADSGGITNLGVTKRAWEKYVGHPVSEADMRALTPDRVKSFYKTEYWDKIHGDDLPAGLDYCVNDTCVNSGPGRAVMLLQGVLGLKEDGALGPVTLAAVRERDPHDIVPAYCEARLDFMKTLPTWHVFGEGWETRVDRVQAEATSLVSHEKSPGLSGPGRGVG